MNTRLWKLARRALSIGGGTPVVGGLHVTPPSFRGGGVFDDFGRAVGRAEEMTAEGADIIDVGGESTRPGGAPVSAADELRRVLPVVKAVAARARIPVSVDTT